MQCKVTSSLLPSIQWLKESVGSFPSIDIASMELSNIANGNLLKVGDDVYLNTLIIDNVQIEDGGLFVCFASNSAGGSSYQSAHLLVKSFGGIHRDTTEIEITNEDNLFIGLVIGLVTVFLIILVMVFVCLIRARQKLLSPDHSESQKYITYHKNTLDYKKDIQMSCADDSVSWGSLQKNEKHQELNKSASVSGSSYQPCDKIGGSNDNSYPPRSATTN